MLEKKIDLELNRFLNRRLQELLKEKGLAKHSHTETALFLQLNRSTWVNFRYGMTNLSTERLVRICRRLDTDMETLFKGFK